MSITRSMHHESSPRICLENFICKLCKKQWLNFHTFYNCNCMMIGNGYVWQPIVLILVVTPYKLLSKSIYIQIIKQINIPARYKVRWQSSACFPNLLSFSRLLYVRLRREKKKNPGGGCKVKTALIHLILVL